MAIEVLDEMMPTFVKFVGISKQFGIPIPIPNPTATTTTRAAMWQRAPHLQAVSATEME